MSLIKSYKAKFFLEPEITNSISLFIRKFQKVLMQHTLKSLRRQAEQSRNSENKNTQNQNIMGTCLVSKVSLIIYSYAYSYKKDKAQKVQCFTLICIS